MAAIQAESVTRLDPYERREGAAAEPVHATIPIGAPVSNDAPNNPWLRRVLMLGGVLVVAGTTAAVYLTGGRYVGTDDAYIKAAQLTVTTDVSGIVQSVSVREGQHVKAGEVLFTLDPQPFEIALQNSHAAVLQATMTVNSLKAGYQQALQQIDAQRAQADVAKSTLNRFTALSAQDAIARTVIDQQSATYLSAVATLSSLRQAAVASLAKLGGNPALPVEQFPDYVRANAALAEAQRQLDHAVVRAPFAGVVAAVSSLQPGALVISAMSAFSTTSAVGLVSDRDFWVEGNMKETDLTRVHTGQPVAVKVDTYPDCKWSGTVEAIAAASGSAFSPLPAQNTSGNWVKVVQRIPVRVKLDPNNCNARLSAGMSALVTIDTGQARWQRLTAG